MREVVRQSRFNPRYVYVPDPYLIVVAFFVGMAIGGWLL